MTRSLSIWSSCTHISSLVRPSRPHQSILDACWRVGPGGPQPARGWSPTHTGAIGDPPAGCAASLGGSSSERGPAICRQVCSIPNFILQFYSWLTTIYPEPNAEHTCLLIHPPGIAGCQLVLSNSAASRGASSGRRTGGRNSLVIELPTSPGW